MKFKILPGSFHVQNFFSSDIGWQGLLASGNNNYVQIVDPKSGQLVQTLEKHTQPVHLVKWAPENFYHDLKKPYSLKLASADVSGTIIVWDATYATILSDFCYSGKKIMDFHWTRHYRELSIDFILILYSGGDLVMWNTDSGNRVWTKNYSDPILDFAIDCHDFRNIAFRGENFVLLVSDFSLTKPPEGNGRKFFICAAGEAPPDNKSISINRMVVSKSAQLFKATTKLVMDLGGGSATLEGSKLQNASNQNNSNCIQLLYHSYCQNHIIIVYPREILIMDLMIFQAVASITLERSTPNFLKVYSCWQNDLLYCLHENGIVTVRGRRPVIVTEDEEITNSIKIDDNETTDSPIPNIRLNMNSCNIENAISGWVEAGHYQLLCQSDLPRLTRNVRIHSMSVAVSSETLISLIMSDTKIQTWELQISPVLLEVYPAKNSYLLSPQNFVKMPETESPLDTIWPVMLYNITTPMVDFSVFHEAEKCQSVIGSYRIVTNNHKVDRLEKGRIEKWGKLTMNMVSLFQGLLNDPTAIRANPVNMNNSDYPLIAVGNSKGLLQLWNVLTSQLEREFQVIHCIIRGIEWIQAATSPTSRGVIIVYGSSSGGSASVRVKNSLSAVRLDIGKVIDLRNDIPENSIEMIRVSNLKQYFLILLKEGPTEIWDCRLLIKIREIAPATRYISIAEWSTGANKNQLRNLSDESYTKEKMLCIDSGNYMQHIIVEGSVIIKGRQVPIETPVNKISAMAYRNNVVIIGDYDGSALFWNFKTMTSVTLQVNQGKIHRIAFDNVTSGQSKLVIIVCSEGVSTWDWKQCSIVKAIKWGKDVHNRIYGADWLDDGSTLALLAATEIRVVRATSLETCCSVINMDDFAEPVMCLSLLPPKIIFVVKHYLQHQPWRSKFSALPDLWNTEEDIVKDSKLMSIFKRLYDHNFLDPFQQASGSTSMDLAIRCYLTAILLGDDYELKFWIVVLKVFFEDQFKIFLPWEMLWPTDIYKSYQKSRLWSLERKRTSHKQTQKCAEAFIMLGDLDRAVRLLLETPPTNPTYVSDLQLACLLANQSKESVRQTSISGSNLDSTDSNINAHHSTVKLVATQFISNNCLKEGVQLLCAINKQSDACRYLETYHEWKTATWLAKCTLCENEISEMKKRWAFNNIQNQMSDKCDTLLQLLSLKESSKVIEVLINSHQYQLATRFIEFCLLENIVISSTLVERNKQIFKEFGEFLTNVSCKEAAKFYLSE